jgi:hypothetical protein
MFNIVILLCAVSNPKLGCGVGAVYPTQFETRKECQQDAMSKGWDLVVGHHQAKILATNKQRTIALKLCLKKGEVGRTTKKYSQAWSAARWS